MNAQQLNAAVEHANAIEAELNPRAQFRIVMDGARARQQVYNPETKRWSYTNTRAAGKAFAAVAINRGTPYGDKNDARRAQRGAVLVADGGPEIARHAKKNVGLFTKQDYSVNYGRVPTTYYALAGAIKKAIQHELPQGARPAGIVLTFSGNVAIPGHNGQIAYELRHEHRTIKFDRTMTAADIFKILEQLEVGHAIGVGNISDPVISYMNLDLTHFALTYWQAPPPPPQGGALPKKARGAAPIVEGFRLINCTKPDQAYRNDCALDVCRALAAQCYATPQSWPRSNTIRKLLNIPELQPIPAENKTFDALADVFGVHIVVYDGVNILPDTDRKFDDSITNTCTSTISHRRICEGHSKTNPTAQTINVYIHDNHYYGCQLLPLSTCPKTGDLIKVGEKALSGDALRDRILSQGRTFIAAASSKDLRVKVCVFDYETVYETSNDLTAYALGWYTFDPHNKSSEFDEKDVTIVLRSAQIPDVTAPFLDYLQKILASDVRLLLVGFNSSQFDHFILAKAAAKRGALSDIFATQAGGLRSLRIYGRHSTLDIAKILTGSLASCCEAFKTTPKKVEGFSHRIPQVAHEAGKLSEWIDNNRAQLTKYLACDVASTASLFVKLRSSLKTLIGEDLVKTMHTTAGGLSVAAMKKMRKDMAHAAETQELDEEIRGFITGGRVQCFVKPGKYEDAEGFAQFDVCSLYPTVMSCPQRIRDIMKICPTFGAYPYGPEAATPEPVGDWTRGRVGIYDVEILTQPSPSIAVFKSEGFPHDWNKTGNFNAKLTSCDLELLEARGGKFKVISGYEWTKVEYGFFAAYIDKILKVKSEHDAYKENKDPNYNPALREVCKLLMNSLSGKMAQANYDDVAKLCHSINDQENALAKIDLSQSSCAIQLSEKTSLVIGHKPYSDCYEQKRAAPSILAVLIYSYSRSLAYELLFKNNAMYSDTDSAILRRVDAEKIRKAYPQLFPATDGRTAKLLGDLDDELKNEYPKTVYIIKPKEYAIYGSQWKMRLKGVGLRDAVLTEDDKFDITTVSNIAAGDKYVSTTKLLENPALYFERRAAGKPVAVLVSQLKKSFKTTEGFVLKQHFTIKHIGM